MCLVWLKGIIGLVILEVFCSLALLLHTPTLPPEAGGSEIMASALKWGKASGGGERSAFATACPQ